MSWIYHRPKLALDITTQLLSPGFLDQGSTRAVNVRFNTPGHFIFIGIGSHNAQVVGITVGDRTPLLGAASVELPKLGQ